MDIPHSIQHETKQLARQWQKKISESIGAAERRLHAMMERMLDDPRNKIFLIELLDQSFRSGDPKRIANQLDHIFQKYEGTDVFTPFETLLLMLFKYVGIALPSISVPLFVQYLRNDISDIVIKGEPSALGEHLMMRRSEGTRVNINIIGEAVLGEEEAAGRVAKYVSALENPDIDYISIKISTIFSQITPVAHAWSVDTLKERLRTIYTAARENRFTAADGTVHNKFVNLDMEEYRDLHLTLDTFTQTLSEEAFMSLEAGIVLQAYLPDSYDLMVKLSAWAKARVENGGAPIKVRLVKGANQEMELTESSLRNWPCVTYLNKADTDANFKQMMSYLISPDVAPYVHVGIASHNLFDHALGRLLAKERQVEQYYTAEMLEGMSEAAYQLFKKEGMNVILYAPTATASTFTNAIAYLVRRFDENTAENNFLRHSFGLHVDTIPWQVLLKSYDDALDAMKTVRQTPNRTQNRNLDYPDFTPASAYRFGNESDTDFSLPANIRWAESIRDTWQNIGKNGGFDATPVIAGNAVEMDSPITVIDKSQFHQNITVGRYCYATAAQAQEALQTAANDPDGWRTTPPHERQALLMRVAHEIRKQRADLIGIAAAEVGKVFSETDVEVSEAIDFLNFYPYTVRKLRELGGITSQGKGVGLVVSPWNFPIAIPVGGIAATLAAGNTVIIKPSSEAILCAYALCQCFWNAGISKNTLQFVPMSGSAAGSSLIPSPLIDFVIFTGSEGTAYRMLDIRPDLHLSAETGGKDATIVTAMADRDQAVKNIVASAFNNSGQKCSATSLLVLERELYEDESFKRMLIDAAASLQVGSVWNLENRIGPLVNRPSGNLDKALQYLDEGESWVLAPVLTDNENPYMLKPSIRWGTRRGDFCHMNELFGPVLSVMCAEDLHDAVDIVNSTGYGLTSGLESLDEREQAYWRENLKAGNLYINRGTTGAIVLRQPFGGMGKSAIGSGKKAGGLNYVTQFMQIGADERYSLPTCEHRFDDALETLARHHSGRQADFDRITTLAGNFAYWHDKEFAKEHDHVQLRGESNHSRYLPAGRVCLRLSENDDLPEVLASVIAAKTVGCSIRLSLSEDAGATLQEIALSAQTLLEHEDHMAMETDEALIASLNDVDRIRVLDASNVPLALQREANRCGIFIASSPFVAHGRIELMHYLIEQSITNNYHRYGNLGLHGLEAKEQ
jgi:RHH-type proline utilization regulon transcriptional repressor/proline dehydrogenase/delta 1-pyrroline-5-carboxylate dehydrogenase